MDKFYVYGLFDPETEELFYIGKGQNYRDKSHLKPHKWKNPKETTNPFLYYKIQSLMLNNTPPIIKRIYENMSEDEAYQKENEIIEKYGRRFSTENGKLFNISNTKGGSPYGVKKPWNEERRKRHKQVSKQKRKYDPSYEELYNDYIVNGLFREDISKKYSVSVALVKKRLQNFGILKPKELIYPEKNEYECLTCGSLFLTPNSVKDRKYCSRKCYMKNRK